MIAAHTTQRKSTHTHTLRHNMNIKLLHDVRRSGLPNPTNHPRSNTAKSVEYISANDALCKKLI